MESIAQHLDPGALVATIVYSFIGMGLFMLAVFATQDSVEVISVRQGEELGMRKQRIVSELIRWIRASLLSAPPEGARLHPGEGEPPSSTSG